MISINKSTKFLKQLSIRCFIEYMNINHLKNITYYKYILLLLLFIMIEFFSFSCELNSDIHSYLTENKVNEDNQIIKSTIKEYFINDNDDINFNNKSESLLKLPLSDINDSIKEALRITYTPIKSNVIKDYIDFKGKTYYYYIYLPENYNFNRKYPILFGLPGSSGIELIVKCTFKHLWLYQNPDDPMIKIMPISNCDTFMSGAQHIVLQILKKLLFTYNIDRDRVYIGGTSNGGIGSYQVVANSPQLWAGCIGIPGGFLNEEETKAGFNNAKYCNFLLGVGQHDSESWYNRYNMMNNYVENTNVKCEQKVFPEQGHFFNESFDTSLLINWFLKNKRGKLPTEFSAIIKDKSYNRFYWICVDDFSDNAEITVKSDKDLNILVINTKNVKKLRIFLSSEIVNFDKKVKIRLNEKIVYDDFLNTTNQSLLYSAKHSFLTGYDFTNCIELNI